MVVRLTAVPPATTPAGPRWRKSSHSTFNGNCAEVTAWRKSSASKESNCAEVGQDGAGVLMRNSKDPDGPWLIFDAAGWAAFLAMVRSA